jgi:hypothetical protein
MKQTGAPLEEWSERDGAARVALLGYGCAPGSSIAASVCDGRRLHVELSRRALLLCVVLEPVATTTGAGGGLVGADPAGLVTLSREPTGGAQIHLATHDGDDRGAVWALVAAN